MEVKTEPAGRLYDILEQARRQPPSVPARDAWAAVFGVDASDTGTILKMLADLTQLMHTTKIKVEALEGIDHDLYLRPFTKIETILSQINLDGSWQHWKNQIDEPTIYGLQFCSDRLNRATNYTKIPNDEVDAIKKSLSELTDQILESDLDKGLKELLIRNLEQLRQALISFKIKGIDGLEQELALNLGSIILHREEIKEKSSNGKSALWEKYFVFLEGVNKTISSAKNIKELVGSELFKLIGISGG